jgi:CubicO group peptidase (beta-lactamase class C family)
VGFSDVDRLMLDLMQREQIPGLAFALIQGQEILEARSYGVTSTEDGGLPITPHTLFRIGSTTKPLVGTVLMQLVEAGQLDLDLPLRHYLPWLTFAEPGASEQITLRRLLTHTSGLPKDSPSGGGDPEGLERSLREQLPHYRLLAPPGTLFAYSNVGINLAGYLAQVVSRTPLPRLIGERLFDPLAMRRTTFDPLVAMTYPLAQPHALDRSGSLRVVHRFSPTTAYAPAGGVYSTVLDLAQFALLHLHQGEWQGRRLLSPESVAQMHQTQTPSYKTSPEDGYGLTFETTLYQGLRCVGHHGVMSTFGCQILLLPEQQLACVVSLNRQPTLATLVAFRLLDELLDVPAAMPVQQPIKPDSNVWEHYTGTYLGARTGLATITAEGGQLTLTRSHQTISLEAYQPGVFTGHTQGLAEPVTVAFIPAAPAQAHYLIINRALHERIEQNAGFTPDPRAWQGYIGQYRDREDDAAETITIRLEGERLLLHLLDSDTEEIEEVLAPLDPTRFYWSRGVIEFQHAADGSIPALIAMDIYTFRRVAGT